MKDYATQTFMTAMLGTVVLHLCYCKSASSGFESLLEHSTYSVASHAVQEKDWYARAFKYSVIWVRIDFMPPDLCALPLKRTAWGKGLSSDEGSLHLTFAICINNCPYNSSFNKICSNLMNKINTTPFIVAFHQWRTNYCTVPLSLRFLTFFFPLRNIPLTCKKNQPEIIIIIFISWIYISLIRQKIHM